MTAAALDPTSFADDRPRVSGRVEHGDERGRLLGFATANIGVAPAPPGPADGVYAGIVHRADGTRWPAAVSIGRRQTFYDERGLRLLEAHLLDFSGDLYGELLTIELVALLRDQLRFDGVEQLIEQLAHDVAAARRALAGELP